MQRASFLLEGTVQGVGLRYLVQAEALRREIHGYVKNLEDGTVEIVCEGRREDIDKMLESIKSLPRPVLIKNIRSEYSEGTGRHPTFRIEHDVPSEEVLKSASPESQVLLKMMRVLVDETTKGFSTGSMYLKSIDSKQDQMLDKQDQMLDKQDQTITEIRSLSSGIREMLDSRFERIENDITKIKSKLQI